MILCYMNILNDILRKTNLYKEEIEYTLKGKKFNFGFLYKKHFNLK